MQNKSWNAESKDKSNSKWKPIIRKSDAKQLFFANFKHSSIGSHSVTINKPNNTKPCLSIGHTHIHSLTHTHTLSLSHTQAAYTK